LAIDFFFCVDGDGLYPNHHCKETWVRAKDFVAQPGNAIDVGCRDGEFTRYLMQDFHHVYCFDPRVMQRFADNVDLAKVTHFPCALGDEENNIFMMGGQHDLRDGNNTHEVPCLMLDSFGFENVSFIKIDVEGFEEKVLIGAENLIDANRPVIVIEQNDVVLKGDLKFGALNFLLNKSYKVAAVCPRGWDFVMVPD
jgi:FkbM family methyltransferase